MRWLGYSGWYQSDSELSSAERSSASRICVRQESSRYARRSSRERAPGSVGANWRKKFTARVDGRPKLSKDERHQILGGVILGAVAGMLMVNISRGRAAWLAGTAANFGDISCVRISKADVDVQHAAR